MNIDEKIKILGLSANRIRCLTKTIVKDCPIDLSDKKYSTSFQIINSDDIVGVYRPIHADDWLNMLDDKYCHKNRNFEKFDYDDFTKLLLNEPIDGFPVVIKYKNKYYIEGNGLHRLTIAKCIGNLTAKVIVKDVSI